MRPAWSGPAAFSTIRRVSRRTTLTVGGLGALVVGCASPPRGFDSPDPSARMEAITAAAVSRDQRSIPGLIASLDSDDPAVRLAAIRALERVTGRTLGYDHAAPPWRRAAMVHEWERWYRAQRDASGGGADGPVASSAGGGT